MKHMTYFFTSTELPYRLTILYSAYIVSDIVSPLLAVGIFRLSGVGGREGWRWYFLFNVVVLYSICFCFPTSPVLSRSPWETPQEVLTNN